MGRRWIALLRILLVLAVAGCGQTLVVNVPDAPALPFEPEEPPASDAADPRVECEFMTLMIDFSRQGDVGVGARVARAMAKEFESLGTRVTSSSGEAYWSLMILASHNSRKDGYIFSAMLSARNMNEGYDPGVTVFQRDGEGRAADGKPSDRIPTLYNGLSYGPYTALEEQARQYVHQAYAAVFPYAQQLCAFEAADKQREQTLDEQLPATPAPL
jgi:hypothetical protein